jgi:hypothetical protein
LRAEIERLVADAEAVSPDTVEALETQVALVTELETRIEQMGAAADEAGSDASQRIESLEAELSGVDELRAEHEALRAASEAGNATAGETDAALEIQVARVSELEAQVEQLRADVSDGESAAAERVELLEGKLADADRRHAESEGSEQSHEHDVTERTEEIAPGDEAIPDSIEMVEPAPVDPGEGTSLSDRIHAAENSQATPEQDSLDAIRDEAMEALKEARALKDSSVVDQESEPGTSEPERPVSKAPVLDYSPSVPAPVKASEEPEDEDKDDDKDDEPVESRYSRNSAKLPRLGIEPGAASSTIADLRKQMTADS